MKKTKRFLSVIVTMLMLFGIMVPMTSAAEFSDVATTHKYYSAISNLTAYGILEGMGDGTFRPDDNVTRAQFAKIICYALNIGTATTGPVETGFTDVAADHWAAGNIKMAASRGIINGMGDGTFEPESNIKFEQAVKMIVCALGYGQAALEDGGYPQGYINVASSLKLLKGLAVEDNVQGKDSNRGTIAKLVDNMLGANQLTSTGEKGESLRDQTVNTTDKSGQVVSVYGATVFVGETSSCSRNQIEVLINGERLKFSVSELESVKSNVGDYLGKRVTVYYNSDDAVRVPTLTNLTLQAKKNIETVIDLADIEDYSDTTIEYIADKDSGDIGEIEISSNANILKNGVATSSSLSSIIDPSAPGQATFLDSDADGEADVVFVKVYTTIIVKSKTAATFKVYGENSESIVLDEDVSSITIKKNGKASEFKNISVGDVLSYASSDGDKVIDVLVSNTVVSGSISQINTSRGTITIRTSSGDKAYTLSKYFDDHSTTTLEVGTNGKFYVDAFGKIVKADVSSATAYTYAYLTGMENVGGATTPSYAIQVVKINGSASASKVQYSLADSFRIDGTQFSDSDEPSDIENALKASAAVFNPGYASFTPDSDIAQVIKFTTNTSGKIDRIITVNYNLDEDNKLKVENKEAITCTTTGSRLGSVYNISGAKVLLLTEEDNGKDKLAGNSASYFKASESNPTAYDVQLIDVDEGLKTSIIIVYGASGTGTVMWEDNAPMVVIDKGQEVPDGKEEPATYVEVITHAGTTTKYFEGEEAEGDLDSIEIGDIIRIALDGEGHIAELKVTTTLAKMTGGTQAAGASGEGTNADTERAEYRQIFGTAKYVADDTVIIAKAFIGSDGVLDESALESVTLNSSTKYILIDSVKIGSGATSGAISESVAQEIVAYDDQPDNASKILIYTASAQTAKTIFIFK